jgi:hypothetical protein
MATSIVLKDAEKYEEMAALWDEYLTHDPSYIDGYYQRATALNWGAPISGDITPYIGHNVRALADLDRAIELGLAADGRYYWRSLPLTTW